MEYGLASCGTADPGDGFVAEVGSLLTALKARARRTALAPLTL